MPYTILPDRSYETTKLLRRSKGVFSKTRRTLTSPPKFRIELLSGPEGFPTASLIERYSCRRNIDLDTVGTVTPAHNWEDLNPDASTTILLDWKPSLLLSKGRLSCKRKSIIKQFLPDRVDTTCPMIRYISDRRPRGVSLQQLVFAACYCYQVTQSKITLLLILNGTVGYRIYSEDTLKSPGRSCRIRTAKVLKNVYDKYAMIPDICLERWSTGTIQYTVPEKT